MPLLLMDAMFGLGFLLLTQVDSIYAYGACIALSFAGMRMSIIKMQAVWQTTVPQEYHGRIFALRNIVRTVSTFMTYWVTGLLLEYLIDKDFQYPQWSGLNSIDAFYFGSVVAILPMLLLVGSKLRAVVEDRKLK